MKPELFQYETYHLAPKKKASLDIQINRVNSQAIPQYVLEREQRRKAFLYAKQQEIKTLDGLHRERKNLLNSLREKTVAEGFWMFVRKGELYGRRFRRVFARYIPNLEPQKMVYASLTGGVIFGILSMALMTQYFGGGVFANEKEPLTGAVEKSNTAGVEYDPSQDIFFEYFSEAEGAEYEENIRKMVAGYPIEEMLPYILEKDKITAAFLIGIAKKESNWGKRVPVLDGQDCYNYWGYRGVRRMMGTGGHTCFNSRQDAVDTVAKRLDKLIKSEQLNTPEKLVVWKCGFSCEGHSRESVKKWISDVDMYYRQFMDEAPAE
ncbi:MAG: hypothetical protein AAB845_01410 [Patescibacteria group bacterium]